MLAGRLKSLAGSTPEGTQHICYRIYKKSLTVILIESRKPLNSLIESLGVLYFAASRFNGSLYHQKHAFYFREVKKWVDCLWVSSNLPDPPNPDNCFAKGAMYVIRGNNNALASYGNISNIYESRLHASWWCRWMFEFYLWWPPHQLGGDNVRYQHCTRTRRSKATVKKSPRSQL